MMHLIIGGAASGKSEYAESCVLALGGDKVYLAAMKPFGDEARRRIKRHRDLRAGKGFETIEQYTDIGSAAAHVTGRTVLLECMSNLTANEIFDPEGAGKENAADAILAGIRRLKESSSHLVAVTLDIFEDGIIYDEDTETFRQTLAEINRRLAAMADQVTRVVYGIPVMVKESRGE
jgi:adenosylcobinamide kinase/adenosylcobinamide-phosphate guanylyltransferase